MYDRMVREHGYSIRKLAEKLGKDKGYLENRLRLADAPPEVRELVSLRKDTLSHAYELMKVEDPKKRRRLADQVARNELSLVKLREQDRGPAGRGPPSDAEEADGHGAGGRGGRRRSTDTGGWDGRDASRGEPHRATTAWSSAKQQLNDAVEELLDVIRNPDVLDAIGADRPGQPRQVPDDRQAPARERDRRRPDRRHGPLGRRPLADTKKPAPRAPASLIRGDRPGSVALGRLSRGLRGLARRGTLGLGGVPLGLRGVLGGLLLRVVAVARLRGGARLGRDRRPVDRRPGSRPSCWRRRRRRRRGCGSRRGSASVPRPTRARRGCPHGGRVRLGGRQRPRTASSVSGASVSGVFGLGGLALVLVGVRRWASPRSGRGRRRAGHEARPRRRRPRTSRARRRRRRGRGSGGSGRTMEEPRVGGACHKGNDAASPGC